MTPLSFPAGTGLLRRLLKGLLDRSGRWPGRCAICHAWPAHSLCETCVSRFASPVVRCSLCALPMPSGQVCCVACLRQPPAHRRCIAAVDYGWPWSDLIASFKFQGQTGWARPFATLMLAAEGMQELLDEVDLVTGVPLSRERLAARGYNQSLLLARALCPDKSHDALLLRLRDTPAQHSLSRRERLLNLQGSLAAEPAHARLVRGRHVLLVDDVMTSGATLQSATDTLLQAGAAQVSTAVFARTPAPA